MIAAVMVTLPTATPAAEQPESVTEVVATPVSEEAQVQLAVEPEAPPLTWSVNTTASPISTSADAGNIETTSGDGRTSRLAVAFDVWPPFMIAAVMVTLPTATPAAEQPESVTEVVATPVSEEAQVQLAVEPEAPPLTWSVNTTVSPISTSADGGAIETTSGGGGGSTSRLAVAFDVWPPFMIAAVMVTLPAATPAAEQPESVTEVVATPVFEDVQVQLAVEPEAPPLTWSANATVSPISTSADAGAIETTSGGGGGVVGVVGLLLSDPEQPTRTETANIASRGILAAPRGTIRWCVKGEATYVSADK